MQELWVECLASVGLALISALVDLALTLASEALAFSLEKEGEA